MHTINTSSRPLLEVSHIEYTRGNLRILDDVTFTIKKGEYIGIVGPNGGGKTTLLNILLGIESPTAGSVHWNTEQGERMRIGYVPQYVASFDPLFPATVREIVASGREMRRIWHTKETAQETVNIEDVMNICNIAHLAGRRIGEVSGGERQRVFLARALVCTPQILVLDEPLSAIDEMQQKTIYELLRDLHQTTQVTILMVSHDLQAIERETSRVLCLNKKIVSHGSYGDSPHMH